MHNHMPQLRAGGMGSPGCGPNLRAVHNWWLLWPYRPTGSQLPGGPGPVGSTMVLTGLCGLWGDSPWANRNVGQVEAP